MRERLDQVLVKRGLVQSRARAADLIRRGAVRVGGGLAVKPGQVVESDADVSIDAASNAHVSRSGAKLAAALTGFGFDPSGRIAIDIGASTGGFSQVLVDHGAAKVFAVDVGRDQLHDTLRGDPRIVSREGLDARLLTEGDVEGPVGAIVADVSFISLRQVLPVPLRLAAPGCWLVALVKPQFEVGRALIGKRGVVREREAQATAVAELAGFVAGLGWRVTGSMPSPLPGKEGNQEFLLGAVRDDA